MSKGKFHGFSIQTNYRKGAMKCRRIGLFEEGLFSGYGFESLENGQWYLGYINKESYQGFGRLRNASGAYMEGNFESNKLNGTGIVFNIVNNQQN